MVESVITNANATSSKMPVLWKDVWWIQGVILGITSLLFYFIYALMIKITRLLGLTKPRSTLDNRQTSSPVISSTSTTVPERTAESLGHCSKFHTEESNTSPPAHKSNFETEGHDTEEFFDLYHHGIEFYDDKPANSSRQRRPRMHSTVTEATLLSMVHQRQHHGPAGVIPPAFPKIDRSQYYKNFMDASNKPGAKNDLKFSSGDMKCGRQINPTTSRLSTVTEEETSDGLMSCDIASCKSEPSRMRSVDLTDGRPGKSQYVIKVPLQLKTGQAKETTEHAEKLSNISCKNKDMWSDKECPKLVECSAEDDAVENNHFQHALGQLECFICKNKIRCICENCRSSTVLSAHDNMNVPAPFGHENEDLYGIQQEFIDDNFEDMESIATDEVADCKSQQVRMR